MRSHVQRCFLFWGLAALALPALGGTWVVTPDGTGDCPTIQAAVDAAGDGDIIELTEGTFRGEGNRNVNLNGKAITVCSQSGIAENCIIDVEGVFDETAHRGFQFVSGEGPESVLRELTIINGVAEGG